MTTLKEEGWRNLLSVMKQEQRRYHHWHPPRYQHQPSLIIQDEAHLLQESLGTFSGIFETAFGRFLKTSW